MNRQQDSTERKEEAAADLTLQKMTGKAMVLISTVLVLAQAAQVAQAGWKLPGLFSLHPGDELKPLCENKDVDLTTRTHFAEIMNKLSNPIHNSECTLKTIEALKEFEKILVSPGDNICTFKNVQEFLHFYKKFIDRSLESIKSSSEAKAQLPTSLQHFVIAYGMQMSKLCKKNMLEALNHDELRNKFEWDLTKILEVTDREFDIENFIKLANGPADFLKSISSTLFDERDEIGKNLHVEDNCNFFLFDFICQLRFEYIYLNIIYPVEMLAKSGFDYTGRDLKANKVTPNLLTWSKATFLCQLSNRVDTESLDSRCRENAVWGVNRLQYEPDFHVKIGEVIYDKTDKNLLKKVTRFDTECARYKNLATRKLSKRIRDGLAKKPLVFCPKTKRETD